MEDKPVVLSGLLSRSSAQVSAGDPVSKEAKLPSPLPRQVQRRLNEPEQAALVERFGEGAELATLAEEFGIHRDTVGKILRRQGVARRYGVVTGEVLAEAIRLHEEGWTFERLGERYGVNASTVYRAIRKADPAA